MDPGLRSPTVVERSRISEGKSSNTSYIELFAHTGTHIDMPWHFNQNGRKILDFGIEEFVFQNVALIDIPKGANNPVLWKDLTPFLDQLSNVDSLLIRTGFGLERKKNPDSYIHDTPGLALETGKKLSEFSNLRCIGVDFISIENIGRARGTGYPVHHALLDRDEPIILLEDANLSVLGNGDIVRLYLFPLRIADLEASPVTAVVEITDN
jgi:kynurenine formamidase